MPSSDYANNGPRNELSKLRTTASDNGILSFNGEFGYQRTYAITVVVPSTGDFPQPEPYVSGEGMEAHGEAFWQILPVGACGWDQMAMLAIRRTDANNQNHRGNNWQFTFWNKDTYLGSSTRVWPAPGTGTTALSRGLEYNFVIRRTFSPLGVGQTPNHALTEIWVNGSKVATSLARTLYTWPASDACDEYWSPRPPNGVMPAFVKTGAYGNEKLIGSYQLSISGVRHGATCADVWTAGGPPCP